MKPKAIIFDLWETLGTKNIGISNTLRDKFGIARTPDFVIKYEESIQLEAWASQEDLAKNFLKSFNIEQSPENIKFVVGVLREGIDRATMFDGMKDLLIKLKQDHKLALLSNTTVFESEVLKRWGIEDLFDATVFSWQIQSLKPARKCFEKVAGDLGVLLTECLFIDDGERNVNAAKEYGLQALHFESVGQLKEDLQLADHD